jgi:hypothetical protein
MYNKTLFSVARRCEAEPSNQHHALLVSSSPSCPTVRPIIQSIDLICQRIQAAVIIIPSSWKAGNTSSSCAFTPEVHGAWLLCVLIRPAAVSYAGLHARNACCTTFLPLLQGDGRPVTPQES